MSDACSIESLSPRGRSRVTNARLGGKVNAATLFVDIDGRTAWGRRYRDVVAALVDDAGGLSSLTELRYVLIRRVAALVLEAERMEVSLANGEKIDVDLLARISSHIRRMSETIGLDRVARDVTPSLSDIIRRHAEKPPERAKSVAVRTVAPTPVSPISDSPCEDAEPSG
jgi:hypothetical protein